MNVLIATTAGIFAFFLMVLLHEWGHFLVARFFRVKILAFSIGFGKAIWSRTAKSGVKYIIGILPLGGYVKMQDEITESNHQEGSSGEAFMTKPLWVRTLVVLAGPVVNILLAVVLFWLVLMMGVTQIKPIVGNVIPNTVASQAGFQSGDEFQAIGSWPAKNWQSVVMGLIVYMGNTTHVPVRVLSKTSTLETRYIDLNQWRLNAPKMDLLKHFGVVPYYPKKIPASMKNHMQYNAFSAWLPALQQTERLITFHFIVIKQMIFGRIGLNTLGGPIAVFQTAGLASLAGLKVYFGFLAYVSVVLGVLNLLPIPGLDGGHLLMYLVEGIIRRPVPAQVQIILTIFGMGFLITLMVYATLNDLMRLFYS